MGGRSRATLQAGSSAVVRRFARGISGHAAADGNDWQRHLAGGRQAAEQHPGPVESRRRCSRRRSHLHLFADPRSSRSHQQLGRSREDEAEVAEVIRGCDVRPRHVCHPVQHGPHRLADCEYWRRNHGLPLRCGQHAHHGSRRHSRARGSGKRRRFCARLALGRRSIGGEPGGFDLAEQCFGKIHLPLPGDT